MPLCLVDGFQNSITLRGLAVIVHLKITVKDAQNSLPNVNFYHISGVKWIVIPKTAQKYKLSMK
jgi:hypothetical protein